MSMKGIKSSIESNPTLFVDVVNKSNSYADLCRYYGLPNNGKQHKYFRLFLNQSNISTNHWDWHKSQRKYVVIEKECPVCKNKFVAHQGQKKEKITCSCKCSNVYFSDRRHTEDSKNKTRESIRKYLLSIGKQINRKQQSGKRSVTIYKIICKVCGEEKETTKKTQLFCSNKCAAEYRKNDPIYKQHLIEGVRRGVKEGRHKGWTSRNILSYPEKFFITVLNNNGIKFVANKPFVSYFLDFAIEDKMIDLEIDGKQHKYPERAKSDVERDAVLTTNGWKVYRIEWNSINAEQGKMVMKEKIDNFLKFYKNLQLR